MPALASVPLLIVYYVDFGVTFIVIPRVLQGVLPSLVDLGWLYYVWMAALSIFCTNSINILAGVNGIEPGQSLVIAACIALNDLLYLMRPHHPATASHVFSLYFLLPFIGVSLALLYHNWFPSRVFVGDTYTYFAGITFAVVGILGHFSKTLLLFFIPQLFNFAYSVPQLIGIIDCPRHRLPKLNPNSGFLHPSRVVFKGQLPLYTQYMLRILDFLNLQDIEFDDQARLTSCINFTLINLVLVWFGPMREDSLCSSLMLICLVFGLGGIWVRHSLALYLFDFDNV